MTSGERYGSRLYVMGTPTDELQPSTDLQSLPQPVSSNVDKTEPTSGKIDNDESIKTAREKEEGGEDKNVRESWKGGLDFLMNLVAYAVGFGMFFWLG